MVLALLTGCFLEISRSLPRKTHKVGTTVLTAFKRKMDHDNHARRLRLNVHRSESRILGGFTHFCKLRNFQNRPSCRGVVHFWTEDQKDVGQPSLDTILGRNEDSPKPKSEIVPAEPPWKVQSEGRIDEVRQKSRN